MFKPELRKNIPSKSLQLDDKKFINVITDSRDDSDVRTFGLGQSGFWDKCINTIGNETGDITKGRMINVDKLIDFVNKSNEEKLANSESEK